MTIGSLLYRWYRTNITFLLAWHVAFPNLHDSDRCCILPYDLNSSALLLLCSSLCPKMTLVMNLRSFINSGISHTFYFGFACHFICNTLVICRRVGQVSHWQEMTLGSEPGVLDIFGCNPGTSLSLRAWDRKAPKLHVDVNFFSLITNSDTLSLSPCDAVWNLCLSAITIAAGSWYSDSLDDISSSTIYKYLDRWQLEKHIANDSRYFFCCLDFGSHPRRQFCILKEMRRKIIKRSEKHVLSTAHINLTIYSRIRHLITWPTNTTV